MNPKNSKTKGGTNDNVFAHWWTRGRRRKRRTRWNLLTRLFVCNSWGQRSDLCMKYTFYEIQKYVLENTRNTNGVHHCKSAHTWFFSFAPAEASWGQRLDSWWRFVLAHLLCTLPIAQDHARSKHQIKEGKGKFSGLSGGFNCCNKSLKSHKASNGLPSCQCQQLVCWAEWVCKGSLLCFDWVHEIGVCV